MKFEVFLTLVLAGHCSCSNEKTGKRPEKKLTLDKKGAEDGSSILSKDKTALSTKEDYLRKKEKGSNSPPRVGLEHFLLHQKSSESGSTKPAEKASIKFTNDGRKAKRTDLSPSRRLEKLDLSDTKHAKYSSKFPSKSTKVQVRESKSPSESAKVEATESQSLLNSTKVLDSEEGSKSVSRKGKEKVESENSRIKVEIARYAAPDRSWYETKWPTAVEIMEKLIDRDEKGYPKISNEELLKIVKDIAKRKRSELEIEEPKETEEQLYNYLKMENNIYVIARKKETVVGMIIGTMSVLDENGWKNAIFINYLFVRELFNNEGVAEEMVKILRKRAENSNQIKYIQKRSYLNKYAIWMFTKIGFEKTYIFPDSRPDFDMRIQLIPNTEENYTPNNENLKVDVARYAATDRRWYEMKWEFAEGILEKMVDKDEKGFPTVPNEVLAQIVNNIAKRKRSQLEIEEPKETEKEVNAYLKMENSIFVIARKKDQVVGMLVGMLSVLDQDSHKNSIIINYLFVDEKFVDKGVAEKMVKILKKKAENCSQIWEINKFLYLNENSARLFTKIGFEKYYVSRDRYEMQIIITPKAFANKI